MFRRLALSPSLGVKIGGGRLSSGVDRDKASLQNVVISKFSGI
jgi:hypothetical protein